MPLSGTGERVTPVLDFPSRDALSFKRSASTTSRAASRAAPTAITFPGARNEPVVLVELDTRQDADDTVSLERDRDTGESQLVVRYAQ
jgi:hypothetical protein